MAQKSTILTGFNDHLLEFVEDIVRVFPEDVNIRTAKNAMLTVRKANPKMLIKIWEECICKPYQSYIDDGDISFFVNKDYSSDFDGYEDADTVLSAINRLRDPIKNMNETNQKKAMQYIQNLSRLTNIYFN